MSSSSEHVLPPSPGAEGAAPPASQLPKPSTAPLSRVRLWDLPTRLFHWLLVASVSAAIATGLIGGDWIVWHGSAGLTILALLVFRIVWGLIGPRPVRFSHFVPRPKQLRAYLAGRWQGLGHNPMGALSVLALLTLLALQAGTGLVGTDEIAFTGPLASLVDDATSVRLTGLHQQLATALFVLLALHVLAVLFHTVVKRDDLVRPMLHGNKQVSAEWAATLTRDAQGLRGGWLAFGLALLASLSAAYIASGAALADASSVNPPEAQTTTQVKAQEATATPAPVAAKASAASW